MNNDNPNSTAGNGPDAASDPGQSSESGFGPADSFGMDAAKLQADLEEARTRSLRLMADFQNYQRRALQNEQVAKMEGAAKVASSVVTVVDHFDLALAQDQSKATVEQLLTGMKVIRDELLKVLGQQGVSVIRPNPNDEFTPGRHEAVMQQAAAGVEPGRIASVFQSGYAIAAHGGERVIRAAKVAVAPQ